MKLFYCKNKYGVHTYTLAKVINQQHNGLDTQIIAPIPTWEQLTTLETLIKDGRFVQALQLIGEIKSV